MKNIVGLIISVIYIGAIIFCGKFFEKSGKEASRKFIHIMLSNWWIIAMIFFDNMWVAAILPFAFVIINYISYKFEVIKVMERDETDENKKSLGTVYYAITLLILALITFGPLNNPLIGLLGVTIMGYGDGLASLIGQSVKSKEFKIFGNKKSIAGSLAMFIVTLIIFTGFLVYVDTSYWFLKAILSAVILTGLEAISIKGTDNLTVPLTAAFLAFLMV